MKLKGTAWDAARRRAIQSKDPICAICQKPIDMEAPPFHPLSVEVDHIVPRARGGAIYDIDNLQLTHSVCNRKKGARMDSDYEGTKVENPFPVSNAW